MKFTKDNASYYGKRSHASGNAHILTREEQVKGGKKGFNTILNEKPHLILWLKGKIRDQGYRYDHNLIEEGDF